MKALMKRGGRHGFQIFTNIIFNDLADTILFEPIYLTLQEISGNKVFGSNEVVEGTRTGFWLNFLT